MSTVALFTVALLSVESGCCGAQERYLDTVEVTDSSSVRPTKTPQIFNGREPLASGRFYLRGPPLRRGDCSQLVNSSKVRDCEAYGKMANKTRKYSTSILPHNRLFPYRDVTQVSPI